MLVKWFFFGVLGRVKKKELSNTFQESFSIDYGAYKSFLYKMKYHKHYAVCFEVFEKHHTI